MSKLLLSILVVVCFGFVGCSSDGDEGTGGNVGSSGAVVGGDPSKSIGYYCGLKNQMYRFSYTEREGGTCGKKGSSIVSTDSFGAIPDFGTCQTTYTHKDCVVDFIRTCKSGNEDRLEMGKIEWTNYGTSALGKMDVISSEMPGSVETIAGGGSMEVSGCQSAYDITISYHED